MWLLQSPMRTAPLLGDALLDGGDGPAAGGDRAQVPHQMLAWLLVLSSRPFGQQNSQVNVPSDRLGLRDVFYDLEHISLMYTYRNIQYTDMDTDALGFTVATNVCV